MEVTDLLATAVAALGGATRDGQIEMAEAVARAFTTGEHLAVQAGTGTGKSLAYLVPAVARSLSDNRPVIVSTATIALQRQLVDRDLPRLADALAGTLPGDLPSHCSRARKLPVPEQDPQRIRRCRTRRRAAGGVVLPGRGQRDGTRRAATDPVVGHHRHRRPRRTQTRCARPVLGAGQRFVEGVHRGVALPVRHRLLRSGPANAPGRPMSS